MTIHTRSCYDPAKPVSVEELAGMISGLARTSAMLCACNLEMPAPQLVHEQTFHAIHSLAYELQGHLMDQEETARASAGVSQMVEQWKAKHSGYLAAVRLDDDYPESNAGKAAWAEREALGEVIAAAIPTSNAAAAAIMEWVKLDTVDGAYDPTNDQARDNVLAYLRSTL